jgi:3-oxoacyl-[acyl-carrier protein] reductase
MQLSNALHFLLKKNKVLAAVKARKTRSLMKLNELKVVVTGGAQGMGAYFAQRLHEAGALVAVGDVNETALAQLPPGIVRRKLDVADEGQVIEFVRWAKTEMSGLNALVNNAGILRDGLLVKRDKTTGEVSTLSLEQFRQVIDVNLTGATLMVREVVAAMVKDNVKAGVIVNLSSIARHGNRGQSNYVAAKAALAANSVTWAREFAPFGIRVGAVAPGVIDTPMTQGMNPKALEAIVRNIPSGRVGVPEDIWLAVRFVLECDYFNARTIDVDGGLGL